jgi:anti-sigma factor RsiW
MSATRNGTNARDEALLHAYHDGELSGFARRRFARRLRRTPRLRRELDSLAGLGERLREVDAQGAAPDLWEQIALRLPAIDARKSPGAPTKAARARSSWLVRPAGALAAAAAAAALAVALLWPDAPESGQVVRWIDGGGRSVMVLDDDPDTTIIWVLDAPAEGASRGGEHDVA